MRLWTIICTLSYFIVFPFQPELRLSQTINTMVVFLTAGHAHSPVATPKKLDGIIRFDLGSASVALHVYVDYFAT